MSNNFRFAAFLLFVSYPCLGKLPGLPDQGGTCSSLENCFEEPQCEPLPRKAAAGNSLLQTSKLLVRTEYIEEMQDPFAELDDPYDSSTMTKSFSVKPEKFSFLLTCVMDLYLLGLGFSVFIYFHSYSKKERAGKKLDVAKSSPSSLDTTEGMTTKVDAPHPRFAPTRKLDVNAINKAVRTGDTGHLRELLHGRTVDTNEDTWGCTALHLAAHNGFVEAAEALLKSGDCANARDAWDETPLHFASRAGSIDSCKLLLAHGAEVNADNMNGWTPLVIAAKAGEVDVCEFLLAKDAVVGGATDSELPPLLTSLLVNRMFEMSTMTQETNTSK